MHKFIITGTDTGIGKTVFAATLMAAFHDNKHTAQYWKPVQSGIEDIDTKRVQHLTDLPDTYFLPEKYILSEPLSPHRAAELDNTYIDIDTLDIPKTDTPLIIEGAGGLMVPLTRHTLYIDMFELWDIPTILCTRTGLGTLNHTLLSIEALQKRGIPIHGIVFIGDENTDNKRTVEDFTNIKILGRLPYINTLNSNTLLDSFKSNFDFGDFAS